MTESQNFVEKELEKNADHISESSSPIESPIPTYTPPAKTEEQPQTTVQIVEKIVYKRQRFHGFFRTLTLLAVLIIGFLMLWEATWLVTLSINDFKIHDVFPICIIISTIIIRSYRGILGKIFWLILFLSIFGGFFTIGIYTSLHPTDEWKTGNDITYTLPSTTGDISINLDTLLSTSYIKGTQHTNIQGTRNSDRSMHINSGKDTKTIIFNEDKHRNILQNYRSKMNLFLPQSQTLDTLYIKSFFWLYTIDTTQLQRKNITFHGGINDLVLKIANVDSGNKIEIQGAISETDIYLPKNIGVLLYYKDRAGIITLPWFDIGSGNTYTSKNINTATTLLHVYINLGVSHTTFHRTK